MEVIIIAMINDELFYFFEIYYFNQQQPPAAIGFAWSLHKLIFPALPTSLLAAGQNIQRC